MIRVAVVDDSAPVRASIAELLDADPDLAVASTMSVDAATTAFLEVNQVDVILMDLTTDAIEATRRIATTNPDARVVILSALVAANQVLAAIDAGAIGVVLKDSAPVLLRSAVKAAAYGDSPIDPRVARILVNDRHDRHDRAPHIQLSERGIQILQLAADGLLNKQIARALGIQEKTVKAHLTRVYERLGVTRRAAAIDLALELGLIH